MLDTVASRGKDQIMRRVVGVLIGALVLGTWGCVGDEASFSAGDSAGTTELATAETKPIAAQQAAQWPNRSHKTRVGKKLMIIGTQTDRLVGTVTDDAIFID